MGMKGGESGTNEPAWVSVPGLPLATCDIPDVENNAGNPRQCALQRHFIDDDDEDYDDEDFLAMLIPFPLIPPALPNYYLRLLSIRSSYFYVS